MNKAGVSVILCAVSTTAYVVGRNYPSSRVLDAHRILYYQDPMHPAYRSSKPGIAPDCGMQLVPVHADDIENSSHADAETRGTKVDAATRQLYGIHVSQVEESSQRGTIRVHGRVAADESRIFRVNLGTDGYVKETSGDAVGSFVVKDQHLALIYSPEFLSVAGGYLSANERGPGSSAKDGGTPTLNAAGAQARADRLRTLGMSDSQIEEISSTRKIPEDVYVVSPTNGYILSRDISPGMRFERHAEFYRIADLSHIWIMAEVFGKDVQAFRPGTRAKVTVTDTGETFTANVSSSLAQVDSVTHLLKPRLEVSNPASHLRPGMFVDVEIRPAAREGLTIPLDAIVDTGTVKRVYVEAREGEFEVREVQTGWTEGDRVQITKGLSKDDLVASSGTFLLESDSRIHSPLHSHPQ